LLFLQWFVFRKIFCDDHHVINIQYITWTSTQFPLLNYANSQCLQLQFSAQALLSPCSLVGQGQKNLRLLHLGRLPFLPFEFNFHNF
jgi:hypothetical protein